MLKTKIHKEQWENVKIRCQIKTLMQTRGKKSKNETLMALEFNHIILKSC